MLKTACSCNPSVVFERQSDWLRHYESEKPSGARERLTYAKLHNIVSVVTEHYVSPNAGKPVQLLNTNDADTMARLRSISREQEALLAKVISLDEERDRLVRSLEPVPQSQPAVWTRSDIKGTCVECGGRTHDMFRRAYKCRPACRPVTHRKIETVPADLEAELARIMGV